MNLYFRDYHAGPRLALVRRVDAPASGNPPVLRSEEAGGYEQLRLARDAACFASDHAALAPVNREVWQQLADGDIITVNEEGLVHRLFSGRERAATVYLTGHCNSNCIMCPVSDEERRTSGGLADEAMMAYLQMLPADVRHITVTGGEPTLRTALFLRTMRTIAVRFRQADVLLLTNGRSFSLQGFLQELLHLCPAHLCVAIPLHAPEAGLHDAITRAPGSFVQTNEGIGNLLAQGIAVELRVVVSRKNAAYLPELADFIVAHYPEVHVVNFIGLETRGNCARHLQALYLDAPAAFRAVQPAVLKLMKHGIDVQLYNFPLCAVAPGFWEICRRSITPEKIRYAPACGDCAARPYCGGFFQTTLAMTKPHVQPIPRTALFMDNQDTQDAHASERSGREV